jgi:hypothetical protein
MVGGTAARWGDFLQARYFADDGLPDRVVDTRGPWYIGSPPPSGGLAPVHLAGGGSIDEFHELADLFVSRDVPVLADALARFIEDETLRNGLAAVFDVRVMPLGWRSSIAAYSDTGAPNRRRSEKGKYLER